MTRLPHLVGCALYARHSTALTYLVPEDRLSHSGLGETPSGCPKSFTGSWAAPIEVCRWNVVRYATRLERICLSGARYSMRLAAFVAKLAVLVRVRLGVKRPNSLFARISVGRPVSSCINPWRR